MPPSHQPTRPLTLFLTAAAGLVLTAGFTPARAGNLTYIAGSLIDSTGGTGVSSPNTARNIQYSDGSGTEGTNFGQIDFTTSGANADWSYDQGSAQTITSLAFWSCSLTTGHSQMPSGAISIYGASSTAGPWTLVGSATRSMVRDTTAPNSQATHGEGFRLSCTNATAYRYVRINANTGATTGGLDNHWVIRKVESNPPLVIQGIQKWSDGVSPVCSSTNIPYNILDSSTTSYWAPQSTDRALTLDLSATSRLFQVITLTPVAGQAGYLPQRGEVRVSSNDDPDNMDTVVGLYNITYSDSDNDGGQIILPAPIRKRYVQLHWNSIRSSGTTETRIAKLTVDTPSEKPVGQDLTDPGIDPGYIVVPGSPSNDLTNVTNINAALTHYGSVYLPSGTYYFNGIINLPDNSRLYGHSDDTTTLIFTGYPGTRLQIGTSDHVMIDHLGIQRSSTNSSLNNAAIFAEATGTDHSRYLAIDNIKIIGNNAPSPALCLRNCESLSVTNVIIRDSQHLSYQMNGPNGPYNYLYGSGIQLTGTNIYLNKCDVRETRNMLDPSVCPLTDRPPNHDVIQAGGIEVPGSHLAVITNNYVSHYGVSYDINGLNEAIVQSNSASLNGNCGVKLCNGTKNVRVLNNTLDANGICGIWLAPGSNLGHTEYNIVQSNTVTNPGKGIDTSGISWNGGGYMDGMVPSSPWMPNGIALEDRGNPTGHIQHNTVTNNVISGTTYIHPPVNGGVVNTATAASLDNTVSGNTLIP